ncbi:hypothetical protein SAMN02744133_10888 [Thalassospira xiamenensis M-5 = DSM 17429]|uniref:hypothetical protein n=1 Tax=Thalassospira xiamenensis TaxID=220697 RepID=UPI00030DA41E|nr:hypothetical protein [Thalassospira xiamenensis]SIT21572.1 hypothetical protein SAMN02744133_10888 [Thalassospira xiamenensis M-5 = DSM 17429]
MGTVYLSDEQINGILTCIELGRSAIEAGSEDNGLNSEINMAITAELCIRNPVI